MRKIVSVALGVAAFAMTGCKKESTTDKAAEKAKQQDNYVQRTAKKYTQSITGNQKAIEEQRKKAAK